jgi:hypothetical protein
MIEIAYQQYKVLIYTDHQYTVESADNLRRYKRVFAQLSFVTHCVTDWKFSTRCVEDWSKSGKVW